MPKPSKFDQLNRAIDAMLARPGSERVHLEQDSAATLAPLVDIARELRLLPRENFKARLKSELERNSSMVSEAVATQGQPATAPQTAATRLRVRNAARAIEFYEKAFGAREVMRFDVGGQIPYAEIEIGNSLILLGEESPKAIPGRKLWAVRR